MLTLEPRWIQQKLAIEGYVRIVAAGQPEVRIFDDLWALLLNLGYWAATHCLGQSAYHVEWLLTVQPGKVSLATESDQIRLSVVCGDKYSTATFSVRDFWPAAVAAATRYYALLERLRGPDDNQVCYVREYGNQARELLVQQGWSLPPPPESDPSPPPLNVRWDEFVLYTRDYDASREFYSQVLGSAFDAVQLFPATQNVEGWVGVLLADDTTTLAGRLNDNLNETSGFSEPVNDDRQVWWDGCMAGLFGLATESRPGPVVARSELRTRDLASVIRYYTQTFDWSAEPIPDGWRLTAQGLEMAVVRTAVISGVPQWRHYIAIENIEAAVARAEALGAWVLERDTTGVWLQRQPGEEFGLSALLPGMHKC